MSIDASYKIVMKTPMGPQESTLVLKQEGDVLNGEGVGKDGAHTLENGKVDGDTLTWDLNVTKPMPIKVSFTAKIEGDTISGEAKLGAFGKAPFSGTKV